MARLALAVLAWIGLLAAPAFAQDRRELFVFSPSLERLVGYGTLENGELRLQVNGYQGPVVALLVRPGAAPTSHAGTLGRGRLALRATAQGPQLQLPQFLAAAGAPAARVSVAVAGGFEPVLAGGVGAGGSPYALPTAAPAAGPAYGKAGEPGAAPGRAAAPASAAPGAKAKAAPDPPNKDPQGKNPKDDKDPRDRDPPAKPDAPTSEAPGKSKDSPGSSADVPGKDAPGKDAPGPAKDAPAKDANAKEPAPRAAPAKKGGG